MKGSFFFLVLFYYSFNNWNPIYKLSTAVKRTEQNRTKLSLFPRAHSKIVAPFLLKLTYNCSKTTLRVAFMQKIQTHRQQHTVDRWLWKTSYYRYTRFSQIHLGQLTVTKRVRDERATFLIAFNYAFEAYNPHRIWRHFCEIDPSPKWRPKIQISQN